MATLYAQNHFNTDGTQKAGARQESGRTFTITGQYNISAAFALNDVIQMVPIPKGAILQGLTFQTTDLDTSTGIVIDIGDGGDTDRFVDGTTIGQTGGVISNNATVTPTVSAGVIQTGLGYRYTTNDTIDVLIQVAATGTAATSGVLLLTATYYCGELAA